MLILNVEATFAQLDKLRAGMKRLEKTPHSDEWQTFRLLIRALTEGISRTKGSGAAVSRKVSLDAPEAVRGDWQELVDMLKRKGIRSERRKGAAGG